MPTVVSCCVCCGNCCSLMNMTCALSCFRKPYGYTLLRHLYLLSAVCSQMVKLLLPSCCCCVCCAFAVASPGPCSVMTAWFPSPAYPTCSCPSNCTSSHMQQREAPRPQGRMLLCCARARCTYKGRAKLMCTHQQQKQQQLQHSSSCCSTPPSPLGQQLYCRVSPDLPRRPQCC